MADILSKEQRSFCMSRIGSKDTKPEKIVRSLVHQLGFRFRLHMRDLPGKPDLAFPGRKKVIFVHGCYWHRHPGCRFATTPKTRKKFWLDKFTKNVGRDHRIASQLENDGWNVLTLWECEVTDLDELAKRIQSFLG